MDIVNEQTTYRVVVEFYAEDGAPVAPTDGTFQVDDVLSGEATLDVDDLTITGATSYVITIPFDSNMILNDSNDLEERVLTVIAQYGTAKQCTGEYRYKVRNLLKVETPPEA